MKNSEIARVFTDIACLLEIKKENPFKIRAYRKAASSIENLPVDIADLVAEERLQEVPGVGEAIAQKITEMVTTGRLGYYKNLRAEFPEGVITLLNIPGISPKTAMLLAGKLGIQSGGDLESAIVNGQIARLQRTGDRITKDILNTIPLGEIMDYLQGHRGQVG